MKPYYLYRKGLEIHIYPTSNDEKMLTIEDLIEMFKNIYVISPVEIK
jgi:hypothetical protein